MYYSSQENANMDVAATIAWMFAPAAIVWISMHQADIWWWCWYIKCMTLARIARIYHFFTACMTTEDLTSDAQLKPNPDSKPTNPTHLSPDQLYETKYIELFRQFTSAYKSGNGDANKSEVYDSYDWIKQKRDSLMRNYIIEYTPIGNCIMRFNNDLNTFEYFSDRVMPYRILETVGQKYVMTYFCKPIYIDLKQAIADAAERKQKLAAKSEILQHIQKLEKTRKRRTADLKEIISAGRSGVQLPAAATCGCEITPQQRQMLELDAIYHGIKIGSNSYTHKGKFAEFSVFPGGQMDTAKTNNCVLYRPIHKKADADASASALTFAQFKHMHRNA